MPNSICVKYRDRVGFRGNPFIEDNDLVFLNVLACDTKRRATCKSKPEIGRFLKYSNVFFAF